MNEREYVNAAVVAKLVRSALKVRFPGHKFSVRSHSYSGGESIRVRVPESLIGRCTIRDVEKVTGPFAGGSFDGMTDSNTSLEVKVAGRRLAWGGGTGYIFVELCEGWPREVRQ